MKIFQYLSFALEVGTVVENIMLLISAKQPLTGAQIQASIQPALSGLAAITTKVPPAEVVTDIANAAADSINRWVFGKPTTPTTPAA